MRNIKNVLRLYFVGGIESRRQLAGATGVSKSAVAELLQRAAHAGLSGWGAIEALDEAALEARLYPAMATKRDTLPRQSC
ncbi:MAG: hypothetical protein ACYCRH_08315 [Acidiferrobacteraceae bacterium]